MNTENLEIETEKNMEILSKKESEKVFKHSKYHYTNFLDDLTDNDVKVKSSITYKTENKK